MTYYYGYLFNEINPTVVETVNSFIRLEAGSLGIARLADLSVRLKLISNF